MPDISAIILQIIVALLSLITGLIIAYFGFRLNQGKKTKDETKLEIIRAATSEIREYSQQTKSFGENKDLLEYIIYKLPIKVNELYTDESSIQASQNSLGDKAKFFAIFNICIFFLQILFYVILDLQLIYLLLAFSIISIFICLLIALEAFVLVPHYKNVRAYEKKTKSLIDELDKIGGTKIINSISEEELTEFIRQRNKLGFNVSINSIKEELEMYEIKVSDSDILRKLLNLYYTNKPEDQRKILSVFFLDGKTHESFDEFSDEEILKFLDTAPNIVKDKPKAN